VGISLFGIPLGELTTLAVLIGCGGVITGVLAGLFGIGGGAIIVPVLYELFSLLGVPEDVRFQLCLGTSFAIIVPTTLRAYLSHRARGATLDAVLWQWALPSIAGVAIGSWIAAIAPAIVFKIVFVIFVNVLAFKIVFGRDSWRLGKELPGRVAMIAYGVFLGLIAALVGVAGGSLCTMVLTLYGKPIHNAVATGAGFGVPVTIAGVVGYMLAGWPHQAELPPLSIGFVSLIGFVLMAPISAFFAGYGVRLAHRLSKRTLELAFGAFLIAVSIRFIVSLL
jgi:uncharacterized membrane protein YfcA